MLIYCNYLKYKDTARIAKMLPGELILIYCFNLNSENFPECSKVSSRIQLLLSICETLSTLFRLCKISQVIQ